MDNVTGYSLLKVWASAPQTPCHPSPGLGGSSMAGSILGLVIGADCGSPQRAARRVSSNPGAVAKCRRLSPLSGKKRAWWAGKKILTGSESPSQPHCRHGRTAPHGARGRDGLIPTPVVAKTPTYRRGVRSQARRPQASVPPEPLQDYRERSLTRRSRGEPPKPWSRTQPGQVRAPSATPREPGPNARPQRHVPGSLGHTRAPSTAPQERRVGRTPSLRRVPPAPRPRHRKR